ncbi:EF-hand domain-containing protein [Xanthomonadaceae bacterium JHOS43]|nr:EF-hand domain-containing protein [Xanthomonadaceae bacterium JHOS43]MCX7562156.1 EF-hand domain-containing protein [Xanthomonadaceae bacterium XH05]
MRFNPWRCRAGHVVSMLVHCVMVSVFATGAAQAQTRADYLRRFDTNGDGRVSLAEYQDYMSQGFHAMDRNGDGLLSAGELPSGVRSRTATTLEGHRRAVARMFDVLDVDNNGYLDANELTAPPR